MFVGGVLNSRLMVEILASREDLQETQKDQPSMLQSIARQLNAAGGFARTELSEGMLFPIETEDELTSMEDKVIWFLCVHKVWCVHKLFELMANIYRKFLKLNVKSITCIIHTTKYVKQLKWLECPLASLPRHVEMSASPFPKTNIMFGQMNYCRLLPPLSTSTCTCILTMKEEATQTSSILIRDVIFIYCNSMC